MVRASRMLFMPFAILILMPFAPVAILMWLCWLHHEYVG